jgi:nucleotide-binding universal stress UspA family protein
MTTNRLPELKTDPGRSRAVSNRRSFASTTRTKRSKQGEKSGVHRGSVRIHDETILVPIDFTAASYKALDHAVSIAQRLNWSVALVHVVVRSYAEGFVDSIRKTEVRAMSRREAQKKLDALASANRRSDLSIRSVIRDGLPEYEILRTAEKIKAKMIVLGRQDRNPLSRLIFGSVSRDILDVARCPVLVINNGIDSDLREVGGIFSTN